ncbi:radical SAM protein [Blautia schinkii]|nr:radical SAM protein [Blautia schinkii]
MKFAGLEIEITRDCNLMCPHCMRYEPGEPMDTYRGSVIKKEYIDKLFEQTERIEMLLLTGGEPLLHPEMITYIVDKIIENHVYVEQIQMITNGTIMSEEAVTALNKAYEYINSNFFKEPWRGIIFLGISEGLHENKATIQEVHDFYTDRLLGTVEKMNSEEPPEGKNGISLTYAGRAKTLTGYSTTVEECRHKIAIDENERILCMIDLTTEGNFIVATPHSFKDADNPDNIICSVNDDMAEGFILWNYRHPLNCIDAECRSAWELALQRGHIFDKPLTAKNKEEYPQLIHRMNIEETFMKEMHQKYPFLYPDDIEILTKKLCESSLSFQKRDAIVAIQNIRRLKETFSKQGVNLSHFCTCPKSDD